MNAPRLVLFWCWLLFFSLCYSTGCAYRNRMTAGQDIDIDYHVTIRVLDAESAAKALPAFGELDLSIPERR